MSTIKMSIERKGKWFKPTGAVDLPDTSLIKFPIGSMPKLDGLRGIVDQGHVFTKSLKLVPNQYIQDQLQHLPSGIEGEILASHPLNPMCFRDTTSAVMTEDGEPDFILHVFDWYHPTDDYITRYSRLRDWVDSGQVGNRVRLIPLTLISSIEELTSIHEALVKQGYEGTIVRLLTSTYKFGKTTINEATFFRIKDFDDGEAEVVEMLPAFKNNNPKVINELGYSVRSTAKANKEELNTLGSMRLRDLKTGVEFSLGTGWDAAEGAIWWKDRELYIGKLVKYRYLVTGKYDKPRLPSFQGFRDIRDMDLPYKELELSREIEHECER